MDVKPYGKNVVKIRKNGANRGIFLYVDFRKNFTPER